MEIQIYPLGNACNEDVYSVTSFLSTLLMAKLSQDEKAFATPFVEAVQAFKGELDSNATRYGHLIREADNNTDSLWSAMYHFLKGLCGHYDTEVKAKAEQVNAIFMSFGCPTRLPYQKAYGIYKRLVAALRGIPQENLDALNFVGWIDALEQRIARFVELEQAKLNQKNDIGNAPILRARTHLLEMYSALMRQIDARLLLMPSESLEDAAGAWNQYVIQLQANAKASATKKRQRARKMAENSESEAESTDETSDLE